MGVVARQPQGTFPHTRARKRAVRVRSDSNIPANRPVLRVGCAPRCASGVETRLLPQKGVGVSRGANPQPAYINFQDSGAGILCSTGFRCARVTLPSESATVFVLSNHRRDRRARREARPSNRTPHLLQGRRDEAAISPLRGDAGAGRRRHGDDWRGGSRPEARRAASSGSPCRCSTAWTRRSRTRVEDGRSWTRAARA